MKIAIPIQTKEINSYVNSTFGRTPYFLIYDTDIKEHSFLENSSASSQGGAGINSAQVLVDNKINVLIAQRCGENAQGVLIKADIPIFSAIQGTAKQNIEAYLSSNLQLLNESI